MKHQETPGTAWRHPKRLALFLAGYLAVIVVLIVALSKLPTERELAMGRGNTGELQRAAEQAWDMEQAEACGRSQGTQNTGGTR